MGAPQTETYFQLGLVTLAMTEGSWLILDDVNKAMPEYLCSPHPVSEDVISPVVLLDVGGVPFIRTQTSALLQLRTR